MFHEKAHTIQMYKCKFYNSNTVKFINPTLRSVHYQEYGNGRIRKVQLKKLL